jgi:uncharacterized repeat protein (TIGR03837 family)
LHVQVLPFLSQEQYDQLLWSCDFNAVRGEDSFVRAQWAGRPLLWHIYQQADDAHLEKLDAFLAIYQAGLSEGAQAALVSLWHAWNQGGSVAQSWNQLLQHGPELSAHADAWALQQASQVDLAAALVQFYLNWL